MASSTSLWRSSLSVSQTDAKRQNAATSSFIFDHYGGFWSVSQEMIGHYLGEFSITYKPIKHGRAGMMSKNSQFVPLKWERDCLRRSLGGAEKGCDGLISLDTPTRSHKKIFEHLQDSPSHFLFNDLQQLCTPGPRDSPSLAPRWHSDLAFNRIKSVAPPAQLHIMAEGEVKDPRLTNCWIEI